MKHNAKVRIVLWSIVIILLVGILVSTLVGAAAYQKIASQIHYHSGTAQTVALEQIPQTQEIPGQQAAAQPTVSQQTGPADSQTAQAATAPTATVQTASGSVTSVPVTGIRELEITWVAGNIRMESGSVTDIQISETGADQTGYTMLVRQKEDKLSISFAQENQKYLRLDTGLSKDLTVVVPQDWICQELEIDAASAALDLRNLTIRDLECNSASGTCVFTDCTVDSLDVNTASGDVTFTGTIRELACEAASANVYATLENVPSEVDMESMSGTLDLTLPENAGFTLSMESMNGKFTSDFETTVQGRRYVSGDGRCKISVETMSGEVILRKG